MSTILNALNKAKQQQARQAATAPVAPPAPAPPPPLASSAAHTASASPTAAKRPHPAPPAPPKPVSAFPQTTPQASSRPSMATLWITIAAAVLLMGGGVTVGLMLNQGKATKPSSDRVMQNTMTENRMTSPDSPSDKQNNMSDNEIATATGQSDVVARAIASSSPAPHSSPSPPTNPSSASSTAPAQIPPGESIHAEQPPVEAPPIEPPPPAPREAMLPLPAMTVTAQPTILPSATLLPAPREWSVADTFENYPEDAEISASELRWKFEGVLWDDTSPEALVNGRIVRAGDKIGPVQIREIGRNYLRAELNAKQLVVRY